MTLNDHFVSTVVFSLYNGVIIPGYMEACFCHIKKFKKVTCRPTTFYLTVSFNLFMYLFLSELRECFPLF